MLPIENKGEWFRRSLSVRSGIAVSVARARAASTVRVYHPTIPKLRQDLMAASYPGRASLCALLSQG